MLRDNLHDDEKQREIEMLKKVVERKVDEYSREKGLDGQIRVRFLVLVEWIPPETRVDFGFVSLSKMLKEIGPRKSRAVGWMVKDEPEYKVIVPIICGEGPHELCKGEILIPAGCITKLSHLIDIDTLETSIKEIEDIVEGEDGQDWKKNDE